MNNRHGFRIGDKVRRIYTNIDDMLIDQVYTIIRIRPNRFNKELTVVELDNRCMEDAYNLIRIDLTPLEKAIYNVP